MVPGRTALSGRLSVVTAPAIHLVTPEYPPQHGGVAEYTQQLADALAQAGEQVHVWCPRGQSGMRGDRVTVHADLGNFSAADLHRASGLLETFSAPRRLIVQWVPHGYGFKAMNVRFCWWLWTRASAGDRVEIMVHEPYLEFHPLALKQSAAAAVQRVMTAILLRAAKRVWVAIPAWERSWKPYALGKRISFTWLPIPTSLAVADPGLISGLRTRYAPDRRPLVGHFGTYGVLVTRQLEAVFPLIAAILPVRFLLIGAGSSGFKSRLVGSHPALAESVFATGELDRKALAAHIAACDVLVQPYPDGISSRRTTAMAGLRLGVPIVTTRGHHTEPFWRTANCVRLVDVGDSAQLAGDAVRLLSDAAERKQLTDNGRSFYDSRFDVRHTVGLVKALA